MKPIGTQLLETNRLVLRRFTIEDAEDMYRNWASDEEVTEYLTWPAHDSIETTKSVVEHWVAQYPQEDFYQWAIVLKEGQETFGVIGTISVVEQNDSINMVHIGYCIGKKWWGQGYASEALKRLVQFFFEEVKVNRIESRFDPRNAGSGKVMEKSGLKYEGTSRQSDRNNQGICDAVHYAILAEDYLRDTRL